MSYRGTTSSRRKIPDSDFKLRAGRELREQAIERTQQEVRHPHEVWGISGRLLEFRSLTNQGCKLTEAVLAREAKERLSLLRAVNY